MFDNKPCSRRGNFLITGSLIVGVLGFSGAIIPIDRAAAASKDELKLELTHYKRLKWTKKVPGYEPAINFDVKWPSGALVAGHANPKTPLVVGAALGAVGAATGSTAFKALNWTRTLAVKANQLRYNAPWFLCR